MMRRQMMYFDVDEAGGAGAGGGGGQEASAGSGQQAQSIFGTVSGGPEDASPGSGAEKVPANQEQETASGYDWDGDPMNLSAIQIEDPTKYLAGKFKSVQDLEKSYRELGAKIRQKREDIEAEIKGEYGPPEEYDVTSLAKAIGQEELPEDAAKEFTEWFKEAGLSQQQAEKVMDGVAQLTELVEPVIVKNEMDRLRLAWGKEDANGKVPMDEAALHERLKQLDAFARSFYGDAQYKALEQAGAFGTAESIMVMDAMMKAQQQQQTFQGHAPSNDEDLDSKINALFNHPAWSDATHPEHETVHSKLRALFDRKYGNSPPANAVM